MWGKITPEISKQQAEVAQHYSDQISQAAQNLNKLGLDVETIMGEVRAINWEIIRKSAKHIDELPPMRLERIS